MATDKYKEFRNYMTNELGITRDDIEAWSKEAVAIQIAKIVPRLCIEREINAAISREIERCLRKEPYGGPSRIVSEAVGSAIASRIRVSLANDAP